MVFFHCGGEHYFSNCPTATKKDHECLNAKLSKMVARLGRVKWIYDGLGTFWAARGGMSMTVYKEFMKVCPELDQPLTCKGANGKPITVTMIVNLHLRLRTVAGRTLIRLGNDMLKMLGIGVQRQLDLFVANVLQTDEDDEFDDQDEPQIGSSIGMSNDLKVVVEHFVKSSIENEFPKEPAGELHLIATRFDIWQLKLGDDPPARVPPMKIRLKPGAQPYRCESRWACSVLPVRSGGDFRQTAARKCTHRSIVPDLHVDLELVKGARFFGMFDFLKEYWQLALANECQEWLLYMTHRKVYTPRRVPLGCTDGYRKSDKWYHDPKLIRALQELPYPKTEGELQ
ncbi:hypothetical protein PHMEG_00018526 [Phytophthora megakarya]|uniref:Reverse transcriptase domain-containing protein n=1 Tax=Phytophthora megakarya TaxID=4795 RepID=A0A225VU64_9STRA|nr:hypothetical protein PHMEG_00018526 [Phytophthora megakarya]